MRILVDDYFLKNNSAKFNIHTSSLIDGFDINAEI